MLKAQGTRPFPWALPKLKDMFDRMGKRPLVGVTHGGSGRRNTGAKRAATNAQIEIKHGKTP